MRAEIKYGQGIVFQKVIIILTREACVCLYKNYTYANIRPCFCKYFYTRKYSHARRRPHRSGRGKCRRPFAPTVVCRICVRKVSSFVTVRLMRFCKVNNKSAYGNGFLRTCCPRNSRKVSEKFTQALQDSHYQAFAEFLFFSFPCLCFL